MKNAFNGFTNWGKGAIDWVKNFGKGWVKIFTGRRRRYDVDLQEDLDVIQPPWWEPEHRPYVDRKKRDDYGLPEELDAEVDQWPRFRRIHLRKRDDNSFEGTDANRYVPRNKRAKDDELTPAQKQCIKGKCNVCHPFIDATHPGADPVDIWRTSKFLVSTVLIVSLCHTKSFQKAINSRDGHFGPAFPIQATDINKYNPYNITYNLLFSYMKFFRDVIKNLVKVLEKNVEKYPCHL